MYRRLIKYGLVGGVALGTTVATVAVATQKEYGSIAVVRAARTAATAVDIGRMYQNMLYSKEWDRESKEYLEIRNQAHQIGANKLLELCRANKGVYIKVGQHVGALDYLLPNEYVETMRILHKDAPQNSVEDLFNVIREELKVEPETIFEEFEEEPLGTASLAQVHRAKLKDGRVVAVKVQHYFVKDNIAMDLKWMEFVIQSMSKVFPEFEMNWLVDETKRNIAKELDFIQEGKNSERVAELFRNYKWLKVPKVHWEYTTSRLLVMDYVYGGQVNDVDYIDKHNINRTEVATKLGDLYSHMIFVTGFVHSDPHSGNILLRQEPGDKEVSVYLLDHGLYAQLTDKFRYHYSKLWMSIISRNHEEMAIHAEALGIPATLYKLFACMVSGRHWNSIVSGIDKTKPTVEEKKVFQDELPLFMAHITHVLESVDRQALLVLKTNDLIRSIEYTLGVQEKMCGFLVMTRCCTESIYKMEYQNTSSILKRQYLNFKYAWSLLMLYFYGLYRNYSFN